MEATTSGCEMVTYWLPHTLSQNNYFSLFEDLENLVQSFIFEERSWSFHYK